MEKLKDFRIIQVLFLLCYYLFLEDREEFKLIWQRGTFCRKPGCFRIGQYQVEETRGCRKHSQEYSDDLCLVFSKGFNEVSLKELTEKPKFKLYQQYYDSNDNKIATW
jgi:hypothetical protein